MSVPEFVQVARREIVVPRHFPAVQSLVVGNDGSMWFRTWPELTRWIVLDETGRLTREVTLPIDSRVLAVTRDRAWVAENPIGEDAVVARYRVPR
jgi:hypothetical protein